MKEKIVNLIDKLLIIDVFLVFVGFFWFAIAVLGDYLGLNLGLATWQKLWIPLFNPAIGILFLGAFLSWGIKKISQFFTPKEN
jgi:hypothetical protein